MMVSSIYFVLTPSTHRDVADRYPNAEVKGMDLSPIQPSWVPPNATFEVDDFNLEWEDDEKYDMIHMRELLGSVKDWVLLYKKCLKALNPGGWVDICEPSIFPDSQFVKLEDDHPYYEWPKLFKVVGQKSGMRFDIAEDLKVWLEEAGFVNIIEKRVPVAIGTWPKDRRQKVLGLWNQARLDAGMRDFAERRMRNTMKVCCPR
jgi:trans-aconitate methyltransferase